MVQHGLANIVLHHFFAFVFSKVMWIPSATARRRSSESSSGGGVTSRSFTMSIDKEPLSPILIRFQQDLQLNGLKERTQQSYVRNVRKFSEFLKRDPYSDSEDDLRRYLLYIKNDAHSSSSTINVASKLSRGSSHLPPRKLGPLLS
jgi:hypothetical protein